MNDLSQPSDEGLIDRRMAADRARRRAVEAGVRVMELPERLTSLRSRAASHDQTSRGARACQTISAWAHRWAAATFGRLAASFSPERRTEYLDRAHRAAGRGHHG